MSQIIVLTEDRIIDGVPRVAGEVVRVAEALPASAVRRTLASGVEVERQARERKQQAEAMRAEQRERDERERARPTDTPGGRA